MRELQGALLYKRIERRNELGPEMRDRMPDDLVPYDDRRFRDPRVDPEEARKIAA